MPTHTKIPCLLVAALSLLTSSACSSGLSRSNVADLISPDPEFSKARQETYTSGYLGLKLEQMKEAPNPSWWVYPDAICWIYRGYGCL